MRANCWLGIAATARDVGAKVQEGHKATDHSLVTDCRGLTQCAKRSSHQASIRSVWLSSYRFLPGGNTHLFLVLLFPYRAGDVSRGGVRPIHPQRRRLWRLTVAMAEMVIVILSPNYSRTC